MKEINMNEVKEQFDAMTPEAQWKWLVQCPFKDRLVVSLDNDSTDVSFDEDTEADYMMYFKDDIGNRAGVGHLLDAIGIRYDFV